MTTIFHAWPYGRFIEIQRNLRRKKLHWTNQDCNFLGDSFSNTDNEEPQSNLEEKLGLRNSEKLSISKDDFSSRTNMIIFTSMVPVLLFLLQFRVF